MVLSKTRSCSRKFGNNHIPFSLPVKPLEYILAPIDAGGSIQKIDEKDIENCMRMHSAKKRDGRLPKSVVTKNIAL